MRIVNCVVCYKKFNPQNERVKCCSRECGYKYMRGRQKKRNGQNVKCPVCGKGIYLFQSQIKRGYKFCSVECGRKGSKGIKGVVRNRETKNKISANHHNVKGENNPNWKGGISSEKINYRNKTWKKYKKWRDSVLDRDGHECKNCGNKNKLHVHHIIARKTLQKAEFIRANGVTLCDKCHRKTDSWGGGRDISTYNRKGNLFRYIMKVIPHKWQDYPTVGNYFYVGDSTMVIFCSDMKNDKFHTLVFAHEMFESSLVLSRKIKIKDIDTFDMKFEYERSIGLHPKDAEPGYDKDAPYRKEHIFATKIERLLAKELDVNWNIYDKSVMSL